MISHPKGTVFYEQFQDNVGMYFDEVEISNTDNPINSLKRLCLEFWVTGEERDLDVSKAILTDTIIKHPKLSNCDLVFFTYEFSSPSPNGAKSFPSMTHVIRSKTV